MTIISFADRQQKLQTSKRVIDLSRFLPLRLHLQKRRDITAQLRHGLVVKIHQHQSGYSDLLHQQPELADSVFELTQLYVDAILHDDMSSIDLLDLYAGYRLAIAELLKNNSK